MADRDNKSAKRQTGEVLLEYQTIGDYLRLAAIDADSGVEVVVMGPKKTQKHELQRIALAKLRRKLGISDDAASPQPAPRGKLV